MKLTIKIALVISLFCATAFAGDMQNGGFAGEMGSGGFACGEMTSGGKCLVEDSTSINNNQDDIFIFVRNFLAEIFG